MSEQFNLFGAEDGPFEDWLEDILHEVLDRNTTEHKHLVIRKNKSYWSVLYRTRSTSSMGKTFSRKKHRCPLLRVLHEN